MEVSNSFSSQILSHGNVAEYLISLYYYYSISWVKLKYLSKNVQHESQVTCNEIGSCSSLFSFGYTC